MATSLEILKKRSQDWSSAPKTISLGEKITKIGPSGNIWQNTTNPTWTCNTISICYLGLRWNYWTDLHQNFTRYSGSSGDIISCIYKALVHSISERQSNEWRWSIMTSKCSKINWLPYKRPLAYHKTYVSFVIPINVTTFLKGWQRSV